MSEVYQRLHGRHMSAVKPDILLITFSFASSVVQIVIAFIEMKIQNASIADFVPCCAR